MHQDTSQSVNSCMHVCMLQDLTNPHNCSSYKLALLKPCNKALNSSSKVSLRVDQRGFLSIQCMILTEDRQPCFVEFLVSCNIAVVASYKLLLIAYTFPPLVCSRRRYLIL